MITVSVVNKDAWLEQSANASKIASFGVKHVVFSDRQLAEKWAEICGLLAPQQSQLSLPKTPAPDQSNLTQK
jgi:hypothetical protein